MKAWRNNLGTLPPFSHSKRKIIMWRETFIFSVQILSERYFTVLNIEWFLYQHSKRGLQIFGYPSLFYITLKSELEFLNIIP